MRHSSRLFWSIAALSILAPILPARAAPPPVEVSIPSGALSLRGFVVRPEGRGPFPVVVYNHGSGKELDVILFSALSAWWQAHGYVVLYPYRRGSGGSPGVHWSDVAKDISTDQGKRAAVQQLDVENDDVVAALDWVAKQPYADSKRIVVAGCSFGGIHSLIAAARKTPARAALDFAGGAMTWATWAPIRARMTLAAREAKVPVFFLQAENDFNTTPSKALDQEMRKAGKMHKMHIYPPQGATPMAGHGGFCVSGMPKWGDDVLTFLDHSFASK